MSQIDWSPDEHMLCVSIHDVAPATWSDCLRLVEAVRAVADIPLTWLVVPHHHFRPEQSLAMEACLNVALERGDDASFDRWQMVARAIIAARGRRYPVIQVEEERPAETILLVRPARSNLATA